MLAGLKYHIVMQQHSCHGVPSHFDAAEQENVMSGCGMIDDFMLKANWKEGTMFAKPENPKCHRAVKTVKT